MENPDYTHPLEIFTEWYAEWYENHGKCWLATPRREASREATPRLTRDTFAALESACRKEKGQCPH